MPTKGLVKILGILALSLFFSAGASAQYGGGSGGTTGGTGTGTSSTASMRYGAGSGKAIGIGVGVAAGAAVGIALLVHHHKTASAEAYLTGCTQSALNGMSLKNETDNVTYMLVSNGASLQPGERVELNGAKAKEGSDEQVFHVKNVVKNYGSCGSTTASTAKHTVPVNPTAVSAR